MIWITIDTLTNAVTPKAGKSGLWFLGLANCIMVVYICIKFQENISEQFSNYRVDTNTCILQKTLFSKLKGP